MPGIVVDANLFVLLIVGITAREYIGKHRRLRSYSEDDFDLLMETIATSPSIIVTPNILTEASNLASQIAEPARTHIAAAFRALLETVEGPTLIEERYVDSRRAVQQPEFPRLWLTDSGILDEMTDAHLLLTVDLDLYLTALLRGHKAMNFNHLRNL